MNDMNKIFLLCAFLLVVTISFGQQKKFVSYTVQQGETMKSIAKDYDMSRRDLMRLNPGVSKKPSPNTVIIVPNLNYGIEATGSLEVEEVEKLLYKVKPKETLYGISKTYGLTIEELIAANPELEDGLKIGMEIEIPSSDTAEEKIKEDFILHEVVKDDTVYNLTRRYSVSEESLMALNPELVDGLKLGMVLKMKEVTPEIILEDTVFKFSERFEESDDLKVVFMLPYEVEKYNDTTLEQSFKKRNSMLNIATDFHLGAELAIDSLRRKGVRVRAEYLDTENSDIKLQTLVNSYNFSNTDVVIGPLFYDKAYYVAERINAPVIAPLYSKKQEGKEAKNLIKVSPDKDVHEEAVMSYLEEHYNGEHILVVNDGLPETQSMLWRNVNRIKGFDSIQEAKIQVIKPEKGFIDREDFASKIDSTTSNWVILLTDKMDITASAVNSIKGIMRFDIKLIAFDKGRNFNNVDNGFLGHLNFVFATSEFMQTDENPGIDAFYNMYYRKNKAYPGKYAVKGFDVTYDILARLASNKGSLENGLGDGVSQRILGKYNFEKQVFGPTKNSAVFLIGYADDLTPVHLR